MKRLPTLLAVVAVLCAAAAATAHGSLARAANSKHDRAALRREQVAVRLINEATRRVQHRHRTCRLSFKLAPRPTFTDARPSDALLNAIGVLRRPATDADKVDLSQPFGAFAHNVYRNWIRTATAVDGRQFVVLVAQDRMRPRDVPRSCLAREHAELKRLLVGHGPAVAGVALRIQRRIDREEHPKGGFKPAEAIFLFDRTPDGHLGGGGGGVDLGWFLRNGMFFSSGGLGRRTTLAGLVPDGVASIDFTFARTVPRGPHRNPKVYPSAIALTERVQDNVVSVAVDRPTGDAFRTRMVWRRADGSVLRVVRSPF